MSGSGESNVLIDTYAWIEYFRGTKEGELAKEYIESGRKVMTPSIVLAELSDKYRRSGKERKWETERRNTVEILSKIVNLSQDSADEAGKIKKRMRKEYSDFPLADGMILAITREQEAKIITGDPHMRDLSEVIDLKRADEK